MTEKDEAGPPTKAGSLRLISGKTLSSCTEPGRSGWLVIVMMASFNQMKEIKPWKGKHCKRRWWYKHKEINVIMIILCNLHCLLPHKSIGFVCAETLTVRFGVAAAFALWRILTSDLCAFRRSPESQLEKCCVCRQSSHPGDHKTSDHENITGRCPEISSFTWYISNKTQNMFTNKNHPIGYGL